MVTTVSKPQNDSTALDKPTPVVELVGPAGTGKTTLLQTLCQHSESVLVAAFPRVRRLEHISFFVKNAVFLWPTLLRARRNGQWLTRQEIVMIAILKGWHYVLARQASRNGGIIVLDPGPVFLLSWLSEFGSEGLRCWSSEKWWDSMIKQWADALDAVVHLDAPDNVLRERINARGKPHTVKGKPEQEMREFLARWRASIEAVISRLTVDGGPRVIRFDTAQESPDQIVEHFLAAFGLEPSGEERSE